MLITWAEPSIENVNKGVPAAMRTQGRGLSNNKNKKNTICLYRLYREEKNMIRSTEGAESMEDWGPDQRQEKDGWLMSTPSICKYNKVGNPWKLILKNKLKRHSTHNQGVWKQQAHGPSPTVCPFNGQYIILIVDFKLHPLVWQLTCHFFHIPRPHGSRCCSKVLRFGVCLIEAAGCSPPSPKSNFATTVTPWDSLPRCPIPWGFTESISVCLLWNICIRTPSPPPTPHPMGTWSKASFPVICAQPLILIMPPVVSLFVSQQIPSVWRHRFRSSYLH